MDYRWVISGFCLGATWSLVLPRLQKSVDSSRYRGINFNTWYAATSIFIISSLGILTDVIRQRDMSTHYMLVYFSVAMLVGTFTIEFIRYKQNKFS